MLGTINNGLEVKRSTLGPHAGVGLFATREYAKHSIITIYAGPVLTRAQAKRRPCTTHIISCGFSSDRCIDGLQIPEPNVGGGSFINDGSENKKNNARWHILGLAEHVYVKALRTIAPGEEIFCSYGRTYWKRHKGLGRANCKTL